MPKLVDFVEFLQTWILQLNIVTRQVSFKCTTLVENAKMKKKWNEIFWVIFEQCESHSNWVNDRSSLVKNEVWGQLKKCIGKMSKVRKARAKTWLHFCSFFVALLAEKLPYLWLWLSLLKYAWNRLWLNLLTSNFVGECNNSGCQIPCQNYL